MQRVIEGAVGRILNATSAAAHGLTETRITSLYLECTIALLLGLATVKATYKIVPYIASFLVFFVKFCLCMLLLSFTLHLFRHSELVQAVSRLMSLARGLLGEVLVYT